MNPNPNSETDANKKKKHGCKPCQYYCSKKSNLKQHYETEKHKRISQMDNAPMNDLKDFMKNMIMMHKDMLNTFVETIKEKPAQVAHVTTMNTNNTIHNNQFNVQVFLNTECKDAIKLSDFMKTLKIPLQDL